MSRNTRLKRPVGRARQTVAKRAFLAAGKEPDDSQIAILPEPELEFRYGQRAVDPHAGLALFGPYDADSPGRPGQITYGVAGRPEGIALFNAFSARIMRPIVSQTFGDPDEDRKAQLLWPPYP